ncbi:MAG: hybrid sensor histidine kinase/response regulator, partial [Gammaproteobacteria bacterium]
SVFGASGGAILLVVLLWGELAKPTLLAWLGTALVFHSLLGVQWLFYRRAPISLENVPKWAGLLTSAGLVIGLIWGAAGYFLFVPESLQHQLYLVMILFTGLMGSSVGTVSHRPTMLAASIPFLLPLIIRLALEGDTTHLALAGVSLVYAITVGIFALNIHRNLTETLNLRFENVDLVAELTERSEEAEQANLAKSRFLAAASHDLRQPLHALGLFVGALDSRIQDPESRALVKKIHSSVDALDGLFNALLDISKLDAGVLTVDIKDSAINPLLARMKADYGPRAEEKGLTLRIVPCDSVVRTDPVLLERLVGNFVSNAINNTHTGSVMLDCRRRNNNLIIEVRDSGIGIPKEHIHDIFEEFYQIGNPERDRKKGLGLGLAIADRISRLLEHNIEVSSEPGKGSVFTVEVPVSTTPLNEQATELFQEPLGSDLTGKFVVVVEDDASVLEAMQLLLADWGCRVLAATSSTEALTGLAQSENLPDVIIADYRLPESATGVQVIDNIRIALNADIPGILITGDTAPDRLIEAEASGYPMLHKPVPPARLRALVSYMLSSKENNA